MALPSIFGVTIDSDGARELLNSLEVAEAVHAAAQRVADTAHAQGHRVASAEALPVEVITETATDRTSATVAVRHPAGVGMEARYGLLKRAAEANGLQVGDRPRSWRRVSQLPPIPRDVAETVVRLLRSLLSAATDPAAAGVKVSTETGRGHDGGPPSLPWLLVAEDGHSWDWPAVQRAVIRLTCWHRDAHTAKRLAGIALGLVCTPQQSGG
ncbi:hypothetical protein F9C11_00240 [Amycolatopsis sp. VS8301801F10]|uniref:hypothetical protein n=1 Tax=Amycolatopsis sp. VS8301801F10 TaxID=2652442 RepID=UPI0038FC4859